MNTNDEVRKEGKEARLKRLPRFIQSLIADSVSAHILLASEPFSRTLFELGVTPEPDAGVAQHDAFFAIVKDALGMIDLSDGEFEAAMRVMTPPEFRGREQ